MPVTEMSWASSKGCVGAKLRRDCLEEMVGGNRPKENRLRYKNKEWVLCGLGVL